MGQYPYRSEQPAWIDGRTADTAIRERDFFRSVYTWMFAGLMLTAASSLLVVNSPAMQQLVLGNRLVFWGLVIAEFGMVFYLSARVQQMASSTAAMLFLGYSALNGLTLSVIFFAFTRGSIASAFFTAAGMFAGMSLYGYMTKRSLAGWGSFLIMGMWGVFIASIVNIFLRSSAMGFIVSIIGVFVFLGLTAYDTQMLKTYAQAGNGRSNLAVYGALTLYLDFINLFLFLLRLFGNRR